MKESKHKSAIGGTYDIDLVDEILTKIIACFPHLQIGERLTNPAGLVKDGKLVEYCEGAVAVEAKSFRMAKPVSITYRADSSFNTATYIHPYTVTNAVPAFSVGDEINIVDPDTFTLTKTVVTQEFYDLNNYVIFRFALA